jgi:hypothetical protein
MAGTQDNTYHIQHNISLQFRPCGTVAPTAVPMKDGRLERREPTTCSSQSSYKQTQRTKGKSRSIALAVARTTHPPPRDSRQIDNHIHTTKSPIRHDFQYHIRKSRRETEEEEPVHSCIVFSRMTDHSIM